MNYIYVAVAVAFLGLLGVVKYQHSAIQTLEAEQVVWTAKNDELAGRIEDQNTRLKDGEDKYNKVQRQLDIAAGKNAALTSEFEKLRGDWKKQPLPKNCDEAIVELKSRSAIIAGKWNAQ